MINELGFEEKHFMFNNCFVHYFKDDSSLVWIKTCDLDEALDVKLNMGESKGFKPLKLKNRNWAINDDCIDKITNVEKLKSKKLKFKMIQTLSGFRTNPNYKPKDCIPDAVDVPPPPDLEQSSEPVREMSHAEVAIILKKANTELHREVFNLKSDAKTLKDENYRLTDEVKMLNARVEYLDKWGKSS